jgi:hypothetical protein
MSIDYSAHLAIGFEIESSMFDRFKVKTDPVWHMEERFSEKTGKKLQPVKVITEEAGEIYRFDGQEYEQADDIVNAICHKLGACYSTHGSQYSYDDESQLLFIIGPKYDDARDSYDDGKLTVSGAIEYPDLLALGEELNRIGQELLKLGLKNMPERAVVRCVGGCY